jgi:hypothetical protein
MSTRLAKSRRVAWAIILSSAIGPPLLGIEILA